MSHDDPFAGLRGQQLPRKRPSGGSPAPTPPAPPAPPLADPQPSALSWPTLRRGLLRGALSSAILLAGVLLPIGLYLSDLGLDWLFPVVAAYALDVVVVTALCAGERLIAWREREPGPREWLLLIALVAALHLASNAQHAYLRTMLESRSIAAALEAVSALVLGHLHVFALGALTGALPWALLVYLRVRGKPLAAQAMAFAAAGLVARVAVNVIFGGGFYVSFALSAVIGALSLGCVAIAWHYVDRFCDRRWGRVPIARHEVQALGRSARTAPA